jgi:ABC-type multidrug transport system fused ATPase/permease subunit
MMFFSLAVHLSSENDIGKPNTALVAQEYGRPPADVNLLASSFVRYGIIPEKGVPQMLEIKNLTKSYGDVVALDRFSLDLKKGEVLGLLGPNGAGKTTLISILAGTLRDFTGTVSFDGRDLFSDRSLKNRIGIVPQDMAFYDELNATDNLLFWGGLYDVPRASPAA